MSDRDKALVRHVAQWLRSLDSQGHACGEMAGILEGVLKGADVYKGVQATLTLVKKAP